MTKSFFPTFVSMLAKKCWPLGVLIPIGVSLWFGNVWTGLLTAFLLNSLLTIAFYYGDKHFARNNLWRIPEMYLHLWELLFGWPGALFAQWTFRHKNRKFSFQLVFWLCVIVNIGVVSWLVWFF